MVSFARVLFSAFSILVTPSCSQYARAQATPSEIEDAAIEYRPGDFARFSPTTALALVGLLPGFSIRDINNTRRGLSGSTGNVLINGLNLPGNPGGHLVWVMQP